MEEMYPGKVNSPATALDGGINDSVQTIDVVSGAVLPDAPNIAVIGTGEDAETILYGTKIANQLTNVTRGHQGSAKAWDSGEAIARMFTELDYANLKANIETHETAKVETASDVGSQIEIFKQKTGVDLEFRTLKALSGKITIVNTIGVLLKENNLLDSTDNYVISGQYQGQYWKPGSNYTIGIIEVYCRKYGVGATITMHVFAADVDGHPTGDELGSVPKDCTAISTENHWEEFDISSESISVISGQKYVFYFTGGTGSAGLVMRHKTSDEVPNSHRVYYEGGGPWNENTGHDATFKIYTQADYIDFIEFDIAESEIRLDDLKATEDNTDLDTSTSKHGLMPKLPFSGDLLSITTVAFNADADTTLYTVPTGKRCILTHAIIVAAGDAGATTTLSIGANGAETDFIPANTLSNLDAEHDSVILRPIPNTTPLKIKSYAAATVIEAQVASQSGVAGNKIYLFGILY